MRPDLDARARRHPVAAAALAVRDAEAALAAAQTHIGQQIASGDLLAAENALIAALDADSARD